MGDEVLTKAAWERRLKARFGDEVVLPKRLGVEGAEDDVRVVLPKGSPAKNMQEDEAAFEGWCLALRVAGARRITLSLHGQVEAGGHGNRFRHRVATYAALFQEWLVLAPELAAEVTDMLPPPSLPGAWIRWVLNVESKPRDDGGPGRFAVDASEHALELAVLRDARFLTTFGLRHVGRQLPVGVFDGEVTKAKSVFTAGKSAVDLWALAEGTGRLALFELKNLGNRSVGALSELLFYATVMRAVQRGAARFEAKGRAGKGPSYRDIAGTSGIDAYVLAPRPHPILARDGCSVLGALNAALAARGEPIQFGLGLIDEAKGFERLLPGPAAGGR